MITFEYKKQFGYILAAIMFVFLMVGKCSLDKANADNNRMTQNVNALQDSLRFKENRLGTVTAAKVAHEVTIKELKNQNWVKDEKIVKLVKDYNKLQSVIKIKQVVEIKEIPIVYRDTVPCIFSKQDSIKTKNYSFNYLSTQKGVTISSLEIPNEQYVITGVPKGGFFKKNELLEVGVTNTNEFVKTKNIEAQVISIPKPFYNRSWFTISVNVGCFLGGYYLGRN